MMVCSNCNNSIPDESKYCPECGVKIEKKKLVLVCPNGHTGLPEDAKFCPVCGELLSIKNDTDRPPRIGDYYFSDGTWASKRIPNKICVGVVFSLKTTEVEKSKGWTHGHIVALQDAELEVMREEEYGIFKTSIRTVCRRTKHLSWGENCAHTQTINRNEISKLQQDRNGYLYTTLGNVSGESFKAIEEFSVRFRLPKNTTSGWYMPTVAQLLAIFKNLGGYKIEWEKLIRDDYRGYFNFNNLFKLYSYGVKIDTQGNYWTSIEENDEMVWTYSVPYQWLHPIHKSICRSKIRPVAAF